MDTLILSGSDRVLVLDEGRVAEYDAPQVLMKRPDSLFHVLLKKMNEQNKKVITNKWVCVIIFYEIWVHD